MIRRTVNSTAPISNLTSQQRAETLPEVNNSAEGVNTTADTLEVHAKATQLPAKVAAAKEEIMRLAKANTCNVAGVAETRTEMEPHLKVLGDYFKEKKRDGSITDTQEQKLTAGVWRSRWFDDADVSNVGPLELNRDRVWQIVKPIEKGEEQSYFYNAFEYDLKVAGFSVGKARGFLRGVFGFSKSDSVESGSRLGIDLEFTYNGIKPFGFSKGESVESVVKDVEDGGLSSLAVPGPIGITGRLRNLYIDEDIRIAQGVQLVDSDINARDIYVQERSDTVD